MPAPARSRLVTQLLRAVGAAGVVTALGVVPALVVPGPATAAALRTTRVSLATDGAQLDGESNGAALSADGRYVGFSSQAPNLLPEQNSWSEAFLRDRQRGTTTVASVSSTGERGDFWDSTPVISGTGRYLAFQSDSTNLVPGDTNNDYDVFVRDTRTGITERISVSSSGAQANGASVVPSISADGRFVVFFSYATDLVPGAVPATAYRHDRNTGATTVVAETPDGRSVPTGYPMISPSGRYVAYSSGAPDLVPGDTNDEWDGFVRDYVAGETVRGTLTDDDAQIPTGGGIESISDNGVVTFLTADPAMVPDVDSTQVFVRDLRAGTTRLVSRSEAGVPGRMQSGESGISRDGRYVVFWNEGDDLVPGDANGTYDVFVSDLRTGHLSLVSRSSHGEQGNNASFNPTISADGRHVAYNSLATNLVPRDTNGFTDVFVTDLAR